VLYLADVSIIHAVGGSRKKRTGFWVRTEAQAKCAFFRKSASHGSPELCYAIMPLWGVFRTVLGIALLPVVLLLPFVNAPLGRLYAIREHFALIAWSMSKMGRLIKDWTTLGIRK